MYNSRPGLLIGFHGCDVATRDTLLNAPNKIEKSEKPYDWLGHGMYFWENNADRALEWARDKKKKRHIKTPSIIGAVLDIGYCCDFTDARFIGMLKSYYSLLEETYSDAGEVLPQNRNIVNDPNNDTILRELDCKVIEFMHDQIMKQVQEDINEMGLSEYKMFDSVRGMFREGGPAFRGAGIFEKTHVQICIRNQNCIKGFFLPRKEIDFLKSILN
jgi:hypothetical protein